ncbi:VWA domain-containing protein [Roseibium sp. MMSF_3544]|uniref:VWA domain-containing protein n=1 Tax=unclassified Roseibium TaxID=2629323 RepID=UPI00273DA111|nr:VWA domain-containing protein [Roseibium sp. MMSF_3544]
MDDQGTGTAYGATPDTEYRGAWQDALLAAKLLKIGGPQLGGLWLKARAGGVREAYLSRLKEMLGSKTPWTRVPSSVGHSALLGSIDIPATAKSGRVVATRGLLARADEGILLLPMAERLEAATAAIIGNAMDIKTTQSPCHSSAQAISPQKARFWVIAIDEAATPEEHVPPALSDRLGLIADLSAVSWSEVTRTLQEPQPNSPLNWQKVEISAPITELLSHVASATGCASMRRLRFLTLVSRMLAAMESRSSVGEADALAATRLCLGVQLQQQPAPEEDQLPEGGEQMSPETCAPSQPHAAQTEPKSEEQNKSPQDLSALTELLAAVETGTISGLPELSASAPVRTGSARTGKAGTPQKNARRGRPVAVSRTAPFPDARPNIIATLRAAAPWQVIRNQNRAILLSRLSDRDQRRSKQPRALITRDDYRFQRLRHETPSTAIFMVDASGSTALERLGETKGAIEQLLSRCYVRRDEVAMIAFRGKGAETVLPPTRSLVMAKRKLAGLPGGGPTPLVSGLEKGLELALTVRRQGSTPVMVLLTDGRGNIARNGEPDRTRAREELGRVASQYRSLEMRSICIDIARRPRDSVASLAETMGADLHFLQYADAGSMSDVVNASLEEARG